MFCPIISAKKLSALAANVLVPDVASVMKLETHSASRMKKKLIKVTSQKAKQITINNSELRFQNEIKQWVKLETLPPAIRKR